jgi:hypothetical protein
MNETASAPTSTLPQLAAIFRGIKAGRHWCFGDAEYADLSGERFEDYKAFFAQLELTLHRDARGFVYATADDDDYKGSKVITRFVVFTAVWVDALADSGADIGSALFTPRQSVDDLPHLNAESHRRILDQVDIRTPGDLQETLKNLERLGFLEWNSEGRFTLRAAFNRLLDVCRNTQARSTESAATPHEPPFTDSAPDAEEDSK